jgi:large subunit ribosomal protein L18
MSKLSKKESRIRRHRRLRQKVSGTPEVPRLSVCRTGAHIYVQVIDDVAGRTLLAASTLEKAFREEKLAANVKSAVIMGKTIAERAQAAGLKKVVFDRGGFPYHGCIKALADAAREAGLEF